MSPSATEPAGPRGTAQTRLLSALTHELRTPLGSILMMSELLAENAEGHLDPREVRYAENIHAATRDLLELIDRLGEIARIEAGRVEVARRAVDPEELVRGAVRDLLASREDPVAPEAAAQERPRVHLTVAPGTPGSVTIDRDALRKLVVLLLESALGVSAGGAVRLLLGPADEGGVEIAVRDAGGAPGEEELEGLFVPFATAGPRSRRRFGGSGLGLPLAAAVAGLLGAELTAEAAEEGCVYRLTVPGST